MVVLPAPVGPVTSTRPLGLRARSSIFSGKPSFSRVATLSPQEAEAQFGVIVAAVKGGPHAAGHAVQNGNAQFPFLLEFSPLLLVQRLLAMA